MDIQLPDDIANAAANVASSHGYANVEDYIAALVRRDVESVPVKDAHYQNTQEWRKRLREWSESHPKTTRFVDTSRESIYGDRGL